MLPAKHDGGIVTLVPCYPILNDISDEDLRNPQTGKYKTAFFFIRIKDNVEYICGCMNSDMTPKKGKEIKAWKKRGRRHHYNRRGRKIAGCEYRKTAT